MSETNDAKSADVLREAMNDIMIALNKLPSDDERRRLLDSISMLLGFHQSSPNLREAIEPGRIGGGGIAFSTDLGISPKDFLREKSPQTDVDRIACLAYYLTHYRGTPHFKTLELSQLNTEAAQQKFSNATVAVKNATMLGYLVPASKGERQISAAGEQYVRLLPDRAAARAEMAKFIKRRRTKKRNDDV